MKPWTLPIVAILITLAGVTEVPALDQIRCSCAHQDWVADCQARVELRGNWFKIVSNTPQCSRVTWYIEWELQTTIVTDGAEMTEWLGSITDPNISVQNCKVCKDTMYQTEHEPAKTDESDSESAGLDLSGYWRSYSTGLGTKGVKGEVEEKIVVSRLNSNEYLVRTLGGVVRMYLGAGDYWAEGECAGSRKYEDPCVVKIPAGGQARLTVNGATARISWDECPDSLQILGRDRMEGSDACGWRMVYTR